LQNPIATSRQNAVGGTAVGIHQVSVIANLTKTKDPVTATGPLTQVGATVGLDDVSIVALLTDLLVAITTGGPKATRRTGVAVVRIPVITVFVTLQYTVTAALKHRWFLGAAKHQRHRIHGKKTTIHNELVSENS